MYQSFLIAVKEKKRLANRPQKNIIPETIFIKVVVLALSLISIANEGIMVRDKKIIFPATNIVLLTPS